MNLQSAYIRTSRNSFVPAGSRNVFTLGLNGIWDRRGCYCRCCIDRKLNGMRDVSGCTTESRERLQSFLAFHSPAGSNPNQVLCGTQVCVCVCLCVLCCALHDKNYYNKLNYLVCLIFCYRIYFVVFYNINLFISHFIWSILDYYFFFFRSLTLIKNILGPLRLKSYRFLKINMQIFC